MLKLLGGFVIGLVVSGVLAWQVGGGFMIREYPSPFGLEETAARIQANIVEHGSKNGWTLSGLRSPSNAIKALGGVVPNVLLIEACSTDYSKPILKETSTRILSILMPCTITVYEKEDGKTYIGMMNTLLMGQMFPSPVPEIMSKVAKDQAAFIDFDPAKPAPKLIQPKKAGGGSGKGGLQDLGGC
ncbi:MAG: DUF302 domain-containing protein [Magnetospiraceae bacterium]